MSCLKIHIIPPFCKSDLPGVHRGYRNSTAFGFAVTESVHFNSPAAKDRFPPGRIYTFLRTLRQRQCPGSNCYQYPSYVKKQMQLYGVMLSIMPEMIHRMLYQLNLLKYIYCNMILPVCTRKKNKCLETIHIFCNSSGKPELLRFIPEVRNQAHIPAGSQRALPRRAPGYKGQPLRSPSPYKRPGFLQRSVRKYIASLPPL